MTAKNIVHNQEAREKIKEGVIELSRAVKATLGPSGRNAIIQRSMQSPLITKDGVTVAKSIRFEDDWMDMGAQIVQQVASKTNENAGDGTTTATVLAESILLEGLKVVAAGANPIRIRDGIEKGITFVVEVLKDFSTPVDSIEQIAQVGAIAANNDSEVGKMLADAMDKVGKDGVIVVEENTGVITQVEQTDGMQWDKGYSSPAFVNNPDKGIVEFADPYIFITEAKMDLHACLPLFEKLKGKPVLIVADEMNGDTFQLLVINRMKGVLNVAAVKCPGFGDRKRPMLEDLAVLTGGKFIPREYGDMKDIEPSDLGRARRIIVDNSTTTIVDGGGSPDEIKSRIEQIKKEVEDSKSTFDKEKLKERIAKLAGGVAKIKVGAPTEAMMKQKKDRVEDAMNATRAAVDEGILPGGGVALLRVGDILKNNIAELDLADEDEAYGAGIVANALSAPMRQIADNAGVNGHVISVELLKKNDFNYGYNALTKEYGDMLKLGVLDPAKVTIEAVKNASSIATLLLTTDVAICEVESKGGDGGLGILG